MSKHNLTLLEALGQVGGLNDVRANKTGVYVFRMGDLETNPTARGRVFRLDLFQPVSIFCRTAVRLAAAGRDLCHERAAVRVRQDPDLDLSDVLHHRYRQG